MKNDELFPVVPGMDAPDAVTGGVVHYGAGNYVVTVDNTTLGDYRAYLAKLEKAGYTKFVDNGSEGLDNAVFNATYIREKLVLTIIHILKTKKTYISACLELPLSEHLFYKEEYVDGNGENARTKIHMLEMWWFGNSFVIQLKNGHFIISDGGTECEFPYLLDYLKKLTPEGEIPVVEGWFFTHGHVDHCGVMGAFITNRAYAKEIFVEGIYYNEPNDSVTALDPCARVTLSWIKGAAAILRTTAGTHPHIYRPQTGQRYYFNDITIDIVLGQEQLPRENYSGDFNDSSTWCMFTIDGQKCLFCGDGDKGGMNLIMEVYDSRYLVVDVFTLNHHGFNTRDYFTDFCSIKTLLLTVRGDLPVRRGKQNAYLLERVEEALSWGDGTKVLTFPYTVGSYETLPNFEWIYNQGQERPVQPNLYTFPK